MSKIARALIVALAFAGVSCKKQQVEPPPPLVWYDLATGEKLARERHMPALLFFGAQWSAEDIELRNTHFPAPEVRAALRGWITIKVDMTNDDEDEDVKAAMRRFRVKGDPVSMAVDFTDSTGDGAELFRYCEFVKAPEMAAMLRDASVTIARRRAERR